MQNVNENILSFTAEHPPPQAVEVIGPYKKVSGNPCGNFRKKLFLQSRILGSAASSNAFDVKPLPQPSTLTAGKQDCHTATGYKDNKHLLTFSLIMLL